MIALPAGFGAAALGVLAFSFTFPATSFALRGFGPYTIGLGRAAIAAVLAAAGLRLTRAARPRGSQWVSLAVVAAGVVFGFPVLSTLALGHGSSASHAAVVIGLLPITTAIFATQRAWGRWGVAAGVKRGRPGTRAERGRRGVATGMERGRRAVATGVERERRGAATGAEEPGRPGAVTKAERGRGAATGGERGRRDVVTGAERGRGAATGGERERRDVVTGAERGRGAATDGERGRRSVVAGTERGRGAVTGSERRRSAAAEGERERPSRLFWVASVAGAVCVVAFTLRNWPGRFGAADLLLFGALVTAGLGYAEGGRLARAMPGGAVVSWALVLSAPVTVPATAVLLAVEPPRWSPAAVAGLAYLAAVSMYLGFFAWYAGLARAGVARASQVQIAQPLLTLLWSWLLLGEHAGMSTVAAAAGVLVCVLIAQRARVTRNVTVTRPKSHRRAVED